MAPAIAPPAEAQLMGGPLTPIPSAPSYSAALFSALTAPPNTDGGVPLLSGSPMAGHCLVWAANGIQDMGSACVASPIGAASLAGTGAPSSATLANRATEGGVAFNLKTDFGAACDGATDDTAKIQAWLNKAAAGVKLVAPAGTCNFSAPLAIGTVSRTTIEGAGAATSTFNYTGPDLANTSLALGAGFAAGARTITLAGPTEPAWLAAWLADYPDVWDTTTGKYVGRVVSVSWPVAALRAPTQFASSGASDALSVNVDLLRVNQNHSGGWASGINVRDLRITSANPLSGGFGVHVEWATQIHFDNVAIDGVDVGDPGNICGGYWMDGISGAYVDNPSVMSGRGKCDGLLVNAAISDDGSVATTAELLIRGGVIGGDYSGGFANGLHMAGGFGGLRCDGTAVANPQVGLLVDNAVAAQWNREFNEGSSCAIDGTTSDAILLDDALQNGSGVVDVDGWTGGGAQGHGIHVKRFSNGNVTVRGNELAGACGSNIYVEDATTHVWVSPSTNIFWAGGTLYTGAAAATCSAWKAAEVAAGRGAHGYGIEASVPTTNILSLNHSLIGNVAGDANANVGVVGLSLAGGTLTTANQTIAAPASSLTINATSANGPSSIYFDDAGSHEWQIGNGWGSQNAFGIADPSAGYAAWLKVSPGAAGGATIGRGPSDSLTLVGNLTANGGANFAGAVTTGGSLTLAGTAAADIYLHSVNGWGTGVFWQSNGANAWEAATPGGAGGFANHFQLQDVPNGNATAVDVAPGGNVTLGESGSNLLAINGSVSLTSNLTVNGGSLTLSATGGAADLYLQAPSGYGTGVVYQANGANKWIGQVDTSGAFDLADVANSYALALKASPGGSMTLGEQNSNVLTVIGSVAAKNGAAPSASGSCAVTNQTGGQIAGSFKAYGACTGGTVILTFAATQANGYACDAHDETTPADLLNQTAHTTASVSLTGTMAAGDVVVWKCVGF